MGFHDFSCYSPMQARPDLELSGPSGILASLPKSPHIYRAVGGSI